MYITVPKEQKKSLTTSLSLSLYDFWTAEAKRRNVAKNVILEELLLSYKKVLLKAQIQAGIADMENAREYAQITKEFEDIQFASLQHTC
jgi:hypothetical protein